MKSILQECLESLIKENERIRGATFDKEYFSPPMFARFLCTVELNMGRGAGHTTAIKNLAVPGEDVIVARFPNDFKETKVDVFSPHRLFDNLKERNLYYKKVFVDGADYIFHTTLGKAEFYEYFSRHGEKTYIFLG